MIVKTFMKSKILRSMNTPLLSFYKKEYLTGYYFENKVAGWLWVWKAVPFKLLGINTSLLFPVDITVRMHNLNNIVFDKNDIHISQSPGMYSNNFSAVIYIGRGVHIAPNVGIIAANHNIKNLKSYIPGEDVKIGNYSWIGMNSVILPGVELRGHTIVGAGSVATKDLPEGNAVIGGNSAKVIRKV